jgi:hypothetical protein
VVLGRAGAERSRHILARIRYQVNNYLLDMYSNACAVLGEGHGGELTHALPTREGVGQPKMSWRSEYAPLAGNLCYDSFIRANLRVASKIQNACVPSGLWRRGAKETKCRLLLVFRVPQILVL